MNSIIIKWFGPYETDEYLETDRCYSTGIYLVAGKLKYEKTKPLRILYAGINKKGTGGMKSRLDEHKRNGINQKEVTYFKCWMGQIVHPDRKSDNFLEDAESAIVYALQPELNKRKKSYHPRNQTSIISFWCNKHGKVLKKQNAITTNLPDVICWDSEHWRFGNLFVISKDDF